MLAVDTFEVKITHTNNDFDVTLSSVSEIDGVFLYRLKMNSDVPRSPSKITVYWKIPAINIKAVWKPSIYSEKRVQYDWEFDHSKSRLCVDSPVVSLYGHSDENRTTFAVSDAVHPLEMNARYREEDNSINLHVDFFNEPHPKISSYEADIRIDTRDIPFSEALKATSKWWEGYEALKPMHIPAQAKKPFYCTWYQFHQNLDVDVLLKEFKLAKAMGFETVIIDDGWQTLDTNRGYAFTGDWRPERIPDMRGFVAKVHEIGLKLILWYSVPLCGKKSQAYQKFKDKLLTDDHRWAPIFDPRYPEVRKHLTDSYIAALSDWNLDGFKLDFIDEFKVYDTTPMTLANGRDYVSVDEAVERMMTDAVNALQAINPDVLIEFRQRYTGPAIRKFGNMFRAFDCPNDSDANRKRSVNLRVLSGATAVHSDPLTWNLAEPLEIVALQLWNTLFSVPQLSMEIDKLPKRHYNMVQHYISFWNEHADVLLNGELMVDNASADYPVLSARKEGVQISGLFDRMAVFKTDKSVDSLYIVNATSQDHVLLENTVGAATAKVVCKNCEGEIVYEKEVMVAGFLKLECPVSGVLQCQFNF